MNRFKQLLMTGVLMLAWLPIHYGAVSAESPAVSPSDANTAGYNSSELRPSAGLSWAPPALVDPVTIVVSNSTRRSLNLDTTRDYIITLAEPLNGGLSLNGGHNIVLIGGEINIPWQGDGASSQARRMLKVQGATGIVHIEGLLGRGEDISEGIQIAAPQAIIQIQNVRIENVHARDEQGFTDNHPDLIQPWGSYRELRVDRFTGYSDYQGIFLKCDYDCPAGPAIIRNTNLVGLPTARYLWWVEYLDGYAVGNVTLDNVWIDVPDQRSGGMGKAVWPDINTSYFGDRAAQIGTDENGRLYATWPGMANPSVTGRITEGLPPNGDMVPAGTVGAGYVSPGYDGGGQPPTAVPTPTSPPPTAAIPTPTPVVSTPTPALPPPTPAEPTPTPAALTPTPPGPAPTYAAPTPTPDESGCYIYYKVKRGDTLYKIARRFGVTVEELAAVNGITDPRRIRPGLILKIPGVCTEPHRPASESAPASGSAAPPPGDASGGLVHIVQAGETLYGIASRYGLSYQELAALNGITNASRIEVGMALIIPGAVESTPGGEAAAPTVAAPEGVQTHVVQPGETLYKIALLYNTNWVALYIANQLSDPNRIEVGQVLIIP